VISKSLQQVKDQKDGLLEKTNSGLPIAIEVSRQDGGSCSDQPMTAAGWCLISDHWLRRLISSVFTIVHALLQEDTHYNFRLTLLHELPAYLHTTSITYFCSST